VSTEDHEATDFVVFSENREGHRLSNIAAEVPLGLTNQIRRLFMRSLAPQKEVSHMYRNIAGTLTGH
jgi:hypothetical protein